MSAEKTTAKESETIRGVTAARQQPGERDEKRSASRQTGRWGRTALLPSGTFPRVNQTPAFAPAAARSATAGGSSVGGGRGGAGAGGGAGGGRWEEAVPLRRRPGRGDGAAGGSSGAADAAAAAGGADPDAAAGTGPSVARHFLPPAGGSGAALAAPTGAAVRDWRVGPGCHGSADGVPRRRAGRPLPGPSARPRRRRSCWRRRVLPAGAGARAPVRGGGGGGGGGGAGGGAPGLARRPAAAPGGGGSLSERCGYHRVPWRSRLV